MATKPVSAEDIKTLRELEARAKEASVKRREATGKYDEFSEAWDTEVRAFRALFTEKDRLCKKILDWAQEQPEYEAPGWTLINPNGETTGETYAAASKVLRKVADSDDFLTAIVNDWKDMCGIWAVPMLP